MDSKQQDIKASGSLADCFSYLKEIWAEVYGDASPEELSSYVDYVDDPQEWAEALIESGTYEITEHGGAYCLICHPYID